MVIQNNYKLCGGIQRGACAPLCVVVGEGYIREGPHRKGPSLMRFFGHFLSAQKVTRVWAGEAQDLRGTEVKPPKNEVWGPKGPTDQRICFCSRLESPTARPIFTRSGMI